MEASLQGNKMFQICQADQYPKKWSSFGVDMPPLRVGDTFPGLKTNLYEAFTDSVALRPDKIAITFEGHSYSYSELYVLVKQAATFLRTRYCIQKGDVVVLFENASTSFVVITFALLSLGAIICPLNTKLKTNELIHHLGNIQTKLLIYQESLSNKLDEEIQSAANFQITRDSEVLLQSKTKDQVTEDITWSSSVDIGDPCFLLFTSGTSSLPKIVRLTHRNILHAAEAYKRAYKLSSSDSTVISVPIFYVTGLIGLLMTFLLMGGTAHLYPRFDARLTLQCVLDHAVTFLHISPTVLIKLIEQSESFPSLPTLRILACGSSYLPNGVALSFKQWLPTCSLQPVFGMTETSSPALIMPEDVVKLGKLGSVGLPMSGLSVKLTDNDGHSIDSALETGNLLIRGTNVIESYYLPLDSSAYFSDGWLKTGDLAFFDKDGFYYISGRAKDLIIRGGENILPSEIEDVISGISGVMECSVFGIPDEVYGESVSAAIVLNNNEKPRDQVVLSIRQTLESKIASFKVPKKIFILDTLPRSGSGKVSKMELRELVKKGELNEG